MRLPLPSIIAPLALLFGLSGAGCRNETVTKVKEMAVRACACGDAACADKVDKEFWDYVKAAQRRGTQEERDEVKQDYGRMRDCIEKVRSPAQVAAPAAGAAAAAGPAGTGAGAEAPAGAGHAASGGSSGSSTETK